MPDTPLTQATFIKVALPVPMRTVFDYRIPKAIAMRQSLIPGMRVKVPFGKGVRLGVILSLSDHSDWPEDQVKPLTSVHDSSPVLSQEVMALCQWASRYYHHPIGEVLFHALPVLLRKGDQAEFRSETWWSITESGAHVDMDSLQRAPRQQAFLQAVKNHPKGLSQQAATLLGLVPAAARTLEQKQLIRREQRQFSKGVEHHGHQRQVPPVLNQEQHHAVQHLRQHLDHFQVSLLDGITGSGKTEVYLRLIEQVINSERQVLVMVPEIGLTPQTLKRFENRFNTDIVVLHSSMNDRERLDAWLMAGSGKAKVILGTRSAVFVPCPNLGLIIIDEEHDASYKQQDGFRYHARDVAAVRAQKANIPLLLGTATPSFESLHNAIQGKYHWLKLRQRAGQSVLPEMIRVDLRGQTLEHGFSLQALTAIRQCLSQKEQVLIFLNRRGFAPTLMCHQCGWIASCDHCDVNLTVHKKANKLHCHHCDRHKALIQQCPDCGAHELFTVGEGTEQVEEKLSELFHDTPIVRIDRDSTQRKSALTQLTQKIHEHDQAILIGTQMLAKGHHFPNVTLVVVMDADVGLFSAEYRGMERTAQLIIQVAGRAGRASKPGRVLLQTYHPDHEAIEQLCRHGYEAFAQRELTLRQQLHLPPFCHQVVIRCESTNDLEARTQLQQIRQQAELIALAPLSMVGPYAAIIVRKAGQHRYLLTLTSPRRAVLHQLTQQLVLWLEQNPSPRHIRTAIDVDPLETY